MENTAPVVLFRVREFEGLSELLARLGQDGVVTERQDPSGRLGDLTSLPDADVLIYDPEWNRSKVVPESADPRFILIGSPRLGGDDLRGPRGLAPSLIRFVRPSKLREEIARILPGGLPTAARRRNNAAPILCVDDDPLYLNTLSRSLTRHGYHVCTSSSARQALDCLTRIRPSLAVVDIMMPEMDGLELTERLAGRNDAAIPVVLLSGLDTEEAVFQGLSRGARYFLHKTRESDKILDVVDYFAGDLSAEERLALKSKL